MPVTGMVLAGRVGWLADLIRSMANDLISAHWVDVDLAALRSEEHTSELQSPFLISYAVFCLDRKSVV